MDFWTRFPQRKGLYCVTRLPGTVFWLRSSPPLFILFLLFLSLCLFSPQLFIVQGIQALRKTVTDKAGRPFSGTQLSTILHKWYDGHLQSPGGAHRRGYALDKAFRRWILRWPGVSVGGIEEAVRWRSIIGVTRLLWTLTWKFALTVPYLLSLFLLPGTVLLPLLSCHTIVLNRHALFTPAPLPALFLLPGMLFPSCHFDNIRVILPGQLKWPCSGDAVSLCPQGLSLLPLGFLRTSQTPPNVIHLIVSCACLSPQAECVL